jgi:hypothetical protein
MPTSTTTTSSITNKNKSKKFIIDADTGLECIDHDDKNCPYWAITVRKLLLSTI